MRNLFLSDIEKKTCEIKRIKVVFQGRKNKFKLQLERINYLLMHSSYTSVHFSYSSTDSSKW